LTYLNIRKYSVTSGNHKTLIPFTEKKGKEKTNIKRGNFFVQLTFFFFWIAKTFIFVQLEETLRTFLFFFGFGLLFVDGKK